MTKAYMPSDESDTEATDNVENRPHLQTRRVCHLELESSRMTKVKLALDNVYVKKVCCPSQVSSMVVSKRDPTQE